MSEESNLDLRNQGKPENRADHVRRDNDSIVTPSITPYDVDFAVLYELMTNIIPPIEENGELITVPTRYASGETATQIQRYGYILIDHQIPITPIVTIQRTGMSKNTSNPLNNLPGDLFDGPIVVSKVQKNNQFDRIDQTYNTEDSVEYSIVQNPKYRIMTYEINMWTQYMTQMNQIIAAIDSFNNRMWGDSFKFRVIVGDFSFETTNTISERRIVRASVSIEVYAHLLDAYVGKEETIRKRYSIKSVDVSMERSQNVIPIEEEKEIRPSKTYIDKLRNENEL